MMRGRAGAVIAPFGAEVEPGGVRFRVWAPAARQVELVSGDCTYAMAAAGDGYFEHLVEGMRAGALYRYRLDDQPPFPDPASRFQPEGVHGPSEVVDPSAYRWNDAAWTGIADQRALVFYELHVGTFSPEGTFEGVRRRLPYLKDLGITAIELMPLADFPGRWNWGYDAAALWAPARVYGRPDALRALVDEAHQLGLAVFLDVIYNHLGPDGAYAAAFGPFFTDHHHTPWGQAINLDGDGSAGVRAFLLGNALHWLTEYHIDGLRLDATFALVDDSPKHFLTELTERVAALPGPRRYLVAEDHRNLDLLLRPVSEGGHGLDGVWADDFHHLARRYVAGDRHGYFQDYPAATAAIARTVEQGWYFTGQYSSFLGEERGTPTTGLRKEQFVFCIQNHDQIGNRAHGERLSHQIDLSVYRALSALLLLLPELPLLFMGQEWAAGTPFQFFTDHEAELGRKVSEGRRREFEQFPAFSGQVPDPQNPATFARSKLDWSEREQAPHGGILALYRDLLARRPALATGDDVVADSPVEGGLVLRRGRHLLAVALQPGLTLPVAAGNTAGQQLRMLWHSEDACYTDTPSPPRLDRATVVFDCPAAVLLVNDEDSP